MFIGIDLGTSSLKAVLVGVDGEIIATADRNYDVSYPAPLWSEQNPEDWFEACLSVLKELSQGREGKIKGIGIAGQMHGLVALDGKGEVIRPCILWNDGRSQPQTDELNKDQAFLLDNCGNIAFAGFTLPKLLWMKENEKENYARIRKILLPKDYLIYRLSGAFATDYSDASGTLYLDVAKKRWSKAICDRFDIPLDWLPSLHESYDVVGTLDERFGLGAIPIVAGAGDNAGAAIGSGAISEGDCIVSLGTSGTVFLCRDEFPGEGNLLHCFAHSSSRFHQMGCILSAASCNKWWIEDILQSNDYVGALGNAKLGESDIFFLPYMMGERSPHNDANARSLFLGMRPNTTRGEMSLAVLEGVTFALRDCVEVARRQGAKIDRITAVGGGTRSKVWLRMLANILNVEVYTLSGGQGPSFGAAILAMVGTKAYPSLEEAKKAIVHPDYAFSPEKDLVKAYQGKYEVYRTLYPALKETFAAMGKRAK